MGAAQREGPRARRARAGLLRRLLPVIRNVLWPFVNYPFWKDSLAVLSGNSALSAPVYVNMSFLISNVLLTLLQYYWGPLIIGGVMKKLKGESVADSKEFKES